MKDKFTGSPKEFLLAGLLYPAFFDPEKIKIARFLGRK